MGPENIGACLFSQFEQIQTIFGFQLRESNPSVFMIEGSLDFQILS
jgi:hypothetical protein